MIAILFRNTPKGDLPHYTYIFTKPEPLGSEIKNVDCYMLGTMLYLEIQKGQEAMKASKFQQDIGATTSCIKGPMMDTQWCGQLTSNETYFVDSCFSGVKTVDEVMAEGVEFCGPVKTIHKGFCLDTFENLTKYQPGRSYLVLKSNPRVPGDIPLMDSRKVLGFIATEGYGSTEPGDTYVSRFPDIFSNVSVGPVVLPHFLGRYLNFCNAV